ncbi:MAG: prepilin peptidase [Planctomycetales bacterium]|nr:prepilin peptidase [Planctomycetales bacterium]
MWNHWPVWMVTFTLIVAAVIDGLQLKVPNWITFPLVLSGWAFSVWAFGLPGLGWSLVGTVVGLALLLPLYAIGGMGAGDVKLLAGVGAWMYVMLDATGSTAGTTAAMGYSFGLSAVVGMILAIGMVLVRKAWGKHYSQFWMILNEIRTVKDPNELSRIAANRKPSMLLLPYGIPIAIGTIMYFAWTGMLV